MLKILYIFCRKRERDRQNKNQKRKENVLFCKNDTGFGGGISLAIQCNGKAKTFFNRPIAFSLCAQLYLQCFNFDGKASFKECKESQIVLLFCPFLQERN